MSTIRAFMGTAGLTDVGYRFYTQDTAVAARVTAGIVDEADGWYSAAGVTIAGDHVRWDSATAPDYKPRQYWSDSPGSASPTGSSTLPSTSPAVATGADTRTVSFLALLERVARRCGLDPEALGTTEAAALADHLGVGTDAAWRHYDWPDTVSTEERALRPLFDLAATYAEGTEVYDPETDAYYRAVDDGFSGEAVTDTDFWEEITDLNRSLALISTGDTPIGEVLSVWDDDPSVESSGAQPLGFHLNGAQLQLEDGPTTVWVRFRRPPPRFTTTAWASGTAYASGDLAYLAPHVYVALVASTGAPQGPASAPTRWSAQVVPELIQNAITRLAKSEWLSAQSQDEKAIALVRLTTDDLDDASATLSVQQGQTRRFAVATRTRTRRLYQPRRAAN